MGYPKGLIRYATENALQKHYTPAQTLKRVLRPRVLAYTAVLWTIIAAAGITLYQRVPVKVDVIRDRITSSRDADDETVENVYRLQIMNTSEKPRSFQISANGLQDMEIEGGSQAVEVGPASARMIPLRIKAARKHARNGANTIVFTIRNIGDEDAIVVTEKASFIVQ
jgi:polyferredoxin